MDSVQKWTLIASLIGAAAWIPSLLALVRRIASKPMLTVTPAQYCEVGFTELGPIINLQVAITADNQNILVKGARLNVVHETGHVLAFSWHEVAEVKGQMIVPGLPRQPVVHESSAIALKVLTSDFRDVVLRFRLEDYSHGLRNHDEEFLKEQRRLVNNGQYKADSFFVSKQVQDMLAFMKSKMVWRSGRYQASFVFSTHNNAKVDADVLSFFLSDDDVLLMQANAENLPQVMRNICVAAVGADANIVQPKWHWLSRRISRP